MTQRDRDQQHLERLRLAYARNLRQLEERRALHGPLDTPVSLANEIRDTAQAIEDIDRVLKPERAVSREVLGAMDEIDRMQYVISMHLKIDSDFRQLRHDARRYLRYHLAATLALMLSTLAGALARPTVTWHVWLIVGVLVAILGYVALDMYFAERKR